MSGTSETQLREDRMLRDAALGLVKADIAHIRGDLSTKGFGTRIFDRVTEGASDILEEAVEIAGDNKGILGVVVAAVLIWVASSPLAALLSDVDDEDGDGDRWE